MRSGPRIAVACALAFAALCAPARAAGTLTVFVDNEKVALGTGTTVAAQAETDGAYGGGHISLKYKRLGTDCAATPAEDDGVESSDSVTPVGLGAGSAVAGQLLQLGVGDWRVCGWLVDDANGAIVSTASALVSVVPYIGSLSIDASRGKRTVQLTLSFSTSAVGRLYAFLQPAGRACPTRVSRISKRVVLVIPRSGRTVGSDGGLGKAIPINRLSPGRWRACALLVSEFGGAAKGSRAFAVPHPKRHRRH